MLNALYTYAQRHGMALPPGYILKSPKVYVCLSSEQPLSVQLYFDETPVPCPDIGSLANSRDKSNVLMEKRSVVLPEEPTDKSRFFLEAMRSAGRYDQRLTVCVRALENAESVAAIIEELDRNKIKPSDRISFFVDMEPILNSDRVADWWQEYRSQFLPAGNAPAYGSPRRIIKPLERCRNTTPTSLIMPLRFPASSWRFSLKNGKTDR